MRAGGRERTKKRKARREGDGKEREEGEREGNDQPRGAIPGTPEAGPQSHQPAAPQTHAGNPCERSESATETSPFPT